MTTLAVTPALPKDAEIIIERWQREKRMPVFIMAVAPDYGALNCRNCNGLGTIYIKLSKSGPYRSPMSPKIPVTYFEGNGVFGKGWYVIEKILDFTCPVCQGVPRRESRYLSPDELQQFKAASEHLRKRFPSQRR